MIDLPTPPPTIVLFADEREWMERRTSRLLDALVQHEHRGQLRIITAPPPPPPEKPLDPPVALRPKELAIRSIDEDRYLRKKRNKALRAKHQPWRV